MNQNETSESSESIDNEEKSLIEVEQAQSNSEKKNTSSGLGENIAGLLCYIVGPITGIIFFILEKENRFIRFHALQSIITFVALSIFNYMLSAVPFVGWVFSSLLSLLTVALWVVLMIKAYQNETFKLPIIGDIAEQQVNK
ncbi:putative membrane protein [Gracilibacillus halotolerans]|uniref:Putative membrane protein n=1 Tax=Gracilibacillus halotolerans TaxID=74386 RepID=A0A841RQP7_9BACI|nr:DUF4870 domain-containing protein [Gracilibacillus halotolerans]MBB6513696.1 putative membrane protein [Gracilibacillus halotolerans]